MVLDRTFPVARATALLLGGVSMSRRNSLSALPLLALQLAVAGCGGGGGGGNPPPSDIGTLAYVATECRDTPEGFFERQALHILHGERDVTVMETPSVGPVTTGLGGYCRFNGLGRWGDGSVSRDAFQGLAVSPDGAIVVFEVSDDFSVYPPLPLHLPPEQKGIFLVRADGSGLHSLGPPSRVPFFEIGNSGGTFIGGSFSFSPDGRMITFADLGPDAAGNEAGQVWTLDVGSGLRRQVTHLPPAVPAANHRFDTPSVENPGFFDNQTIGFLTLANPDGLNADEGHFLPLLVGSDGSDLRAAPAPVTSPDSGIDFHFVITGDKPAAVMLFMPGQAKNPTTLLGRTSIFEIFAVDGRNLLQLTNFQRVDTFTGTLDVHRQTVFFLASADPFGTNPSENCQIFSIDRLGGNLRQLTQFSEGNHSTLGCYFGPGSGCAIIDVTQDSTTGMLVFYSSCDPLGTNPRGGQMFAMRPDGSGLRQLTQTRGLVTQQDHTVMDELPGPVAYGPYGNPGSH